MNAIILVYAPLRVNNNFFKFKKNIKSMDNILSILGFGGHARSKSEQMIIKMLRLIFFYFFYKKQLNYL